MAISLITSEVKVGVSSVAKKVEASLIRKSLGAITFGAIKPEESQKISRSKSVINID